MLRRVMRNMLGIDELERRVEEIEDRLETVEAQTNKTLQRFGRFNDKSQDTLSLMGGQIQDLIETCEALVDRSVSEQAIRRCKKLLKRLRNNATRIRNAQTKGDQDVTVKKTGR